MTIKDVAEAANTSITSVSLVLNGKDIRISDQKRAEIMRVAEEMNFTPNRAARSLKSKRSNTYALVVPDIGNPAYSEFSKCMLENLREKGVNLTIYDNDNKTEYDIACLKSLSEGTFDAAVVMLSNAQQMPETMREFAEAYKRIKIPLVMVNRIVAHYGCYGVTVDHRKGGYIGTKHLLELGHRRIACMANSIIQVSSQGRYFGYLDAIGEYGISLDESLVLHADYTFGGAYELAGKLLETDATACFVCTDLMAHAVVKRFLDAGKRVPEDFSVVGFDDIFFSEISLVPLTTVHTPVQTIADKAVSLIAEALENKDKKKELVVVEPSLVVRKSTCAPRT